MGRATAIAFAAAGAKLLLVDISEKGIQETAAIIAKQSPNCQHKLYILDITNEAAVKKLFAEIPTMKGFDRIDYAL